MYDYKALVKRVIDGDTYVLDVDLGFYMTYEVHCRLAHINCPEVSTPEGVAAQQWAKANVEGKQVVAITYKTADKYGRWLAVITLDNVDINQKMIDMGMAVPYEGGAR